LPTHPADWTPSTTRAAVLPLRVHVQETPTSCWAAVATSVAAFYGEVLLQTELGQRMGVPLTQRARVDLALGPYLRQSTKGPASIASVQAEIKAGNPLCAVLESDAGKVHFVLIHGHDSQDALPRLLLADPKAGHSWHRYRDFPGNYGPGGSWIWTCWLHQPPCDISA
jgi:hypothetical protein